MKMPSMRSLKTWKTLLTAAATTWRKPWSCSKTYLMTFQLRKGNRSVWRRSFKPRSTASNALSMKSKVLSNRRHVRTSSTSLLPTKFPLNARLLRNQLQSVSINLTKLTRRLSIRPLRIYETNRRKRSKQLVKTLNSGRNRTHRSSKNTTIKKLSELRQKMLKGWKNVRLMLRSSKTVKPNWR